MSDFNGFRTLGRISFDRDANDAIKRIGEAIAQMNPEQLTRLQELLAEGERIDRAVTQVGREGENMAWAQTAR